MTKANKIMIVLAGASLSVAIFIGVIQYSKSSNITQTTQGDKNVQIIGDRNYVDNRTYFFKLGINSELSYSFSGIEHSTDGKYIRKLTIEAKGNIPVYNPKIYLRFNKVIQKVEHKGVGVLFMVRIKGASNSNEYFFSTKEFSPGFRMEFVFSNDTDFDILKFRINDKNIF